MGGPEGLGPSTRSTGKTLKSIALLCSLLISLYKHRLGGKQEKELTRLPTGLLLPLQSRLAVLAAQRPHAPLVPLPFSLCTACMLWPEGGNLGSRV